MGYAQSQAGEFDAYTTLAALVWMGVFVFFPLFNRDRLRVGDVIAGTWVVRTPRRKLGRDLADEGGGRAGYDFSRDQVDAYGAHELHVLESVLRRRDRKTMRAVAERIAARIGWPPEAIGHEQDFLTAYYAALRGRLEQRLLMGVRRRDKHDA
jgi:hypothetical protein